MAKKFINKTYIEGAVYQHSLELKKTGEQSKNPGTEYIAGDLEIATDDNGINIVPVHFTYVTATTGSGKANATFGVLMNFINGIYKTIMADSADIATKVRIDSAIGLNEFYSDRNGKEEFISVKRNEGGFVHVEQAFDKTDENQRNTFDCDIVITGARRIEEDEEKQQPEKMILKGAIFNFRNALLPVEFTVLDPRAMDYFESLGASTNSPVFTHIKGEQISEVIVRTVTEESAFGAPSVREFKSTRKDFVVTWAASELYAWDDESTITANMMKEAMTGRELYLAELKKRREDYKASQNKPAAAPANGGFNF